jgi:hypothetical protein
VAAVLEAFKQEMKKDMLDLFGKVMSAQAPPVTETAQGDGVASTQALQGQVRTLERAVAELKESPARRSGRCSISTEAFADLQGPRRENSKLQATMEQQAASMTSGAEEPFFSHAGEVAPRGSGLG